MGSSNFTHSSALFGSPLFALASFSAAVVVPYVFSRASQYSANVYAFTIPFEASLHLGLRIGAHFQKRRLSLAEEVDCLHFDLNVFSLTLKQSRHAACCRSTGDCTLSLKSQYVKRSLSTHPRSSSPGLQQGPVWSSQFARNVMSALTPFRRGSVRVSTSLVCVKAKPDRSVLATRLMDGDPKIWQS